MTTINLEPSAKELADASFGESPPAATTSFAPAVSVT